MSQLKVGDEIPSFEEKDEQGNIVSSTLLKGTKYILFCYPKDDTPGCTAENCSLRDHYKTLKDMGFAIYGVSPDNEKKHLKFKDKYQLPFPLIADTEWRSNNARFRRFPIASVQPMFRSRLWATSEQNSIRRMRLRPQ